MLLMIDNLHEYLAWCINVQWLQVIWLITKRFFPVAFIAI
jgi:hypothetical protein